VAGVIVGNELARTVGIEVLRIGDMNVLGACVVAQLFMIGLSLLAALGPIRVEE
jgi:hypothetical protein